MTNRLRFRAILALAATQSVIGCSRFVWKEDPFTPDQAPTTEIVASGRDTTYVLRGSSYYLLAQQRNTLWNREVMDDVAWRYRALFGDAPPTIAVRLDSVQTSRPADTTWRGLPLATVAVRRPSTAASAKSSDDRDRERPEADDSVRIRLIMGPMLAATAAEAWLEARATAAAGGSDGQPGGPERASPASGALPAWMEAGALRILASGGAPDRAAAELRANQKGIVSLASLFAVAWQRKPNAMEIARSGLGRFDDDADIRMIDGPSAARPRRDAIPGVPPLFIAQSVSVLAFLHERDASLVKRLADDLPRGASVENVLASSTTLPHDVSGLDAAWRKWLQRSARRR